MHDPELSINVFLLASEPIIFTIIILLPPHLLRLVSFFYFALALHTVTLPCHFALALCLGTLPWHFALALCLGTLPWHFALALCLGTLPWHFALALRLGLKTNNTTTCVCILSRTYSIVFHPPNFINNPCVNLCVCVCVCVRV